MTTFEVLQLKSTIEQIIAESNLPKEVVRLVLNEIYNNVRMQAYDEAMKELKEKENEDGKSESLNRPEDSK